MKRSWINRIIRESERFLAGRAFALPPFASWAPQDWPSKGEEVCGIVARGLGWDVTDFASGAFDRTGLVLFTLRNAPKDAGQGGGKGTYAEKVMIVRENQVTPMHFHWTKTEDIVNRGGGRLAVCVHWATEDEALSDADVSYMSDGQEHTVPAGFVASFAPGESITLPPRLYHSFWAVDGDVLAGEISTINDDRRDNRFLEKVLRFPAIEEDEPPHRLLVSDYERFRCEV